MSKPLVVFQREYAQLVKKKSFLIMTLLMPVIMIALMLLPALIATRDVAGTETVAIIDRDTLNVGAAVAEDLARYTQGDDSIPAYDLDPVAVLPAGSDSAYEAQYERRVNEINADLLKYLLVINPGALASDSSLVLVTNSDNVRTISRMEQSLTSVLSRLRLEEADVNLAVDSVLSLTRRVELLKFDTRGESIPSEFKLIVGVVFVMLIYMLVLLNGTAVMRSVIEEKTNRIMEVLVSSVTPFQLMLGKIGGMGAASLTQVGIWVAAGAAIMAYTAGGVQNELSRPLEVILFNPVVAGAFVVFFIMGYFLYSTYFALIGSVVNNDKESQNFMWPVVLCLISPVLFVSAVVQNPNALWVKVLSLLPPFSPTTMVLRVSLIAPSTTHYSLFSGILGEAILSFIILVLTTLGAIWLTGRVFRVGVLMYGKRPTLPEILKWMTHA